MAVEEEEEGAADVTAGHSVAPPPGSVGLGVRDRQLVGVLGLVGLAETSFLTYEKLLAPPVSGSPIHVVRPSPSYDYLTPFLLSQPYSLKTTIP